MRTRFVRETSCVHGYFQDCTFLLDSGEPCPGGTNREVTLKELPYAKEAVELWHNNGLTVEFLEGMTYNHRVQLVGAANRYCELGGW